MSNEDILKYATGRPASKWVFEFDQFGILTIHCADCGAVIEKDEAFWHNYYFCYNCGNYMTNATTIYDEVKEYLNGTDKDGIHSRNS